MRIAEGKSSLRDIPPPILYSLAEEQAPPTPKSHKANGKPSGKSSKKKTRTVRRKSPAPARGLHLAPAEDDHIESALS